MVNWCAVRDRQCTSKDSGIQSTLPLLGTKGQMLRDCANVSRERSESEAESLARVPGALSRKRTIDTGCSTGPSTASPLLYPPSMCVSRQ